MAYVDKINGMTIHQYGGGRRKSEYQNGVAFAPIETVATYSSKI